MLLRILPAALCAAACILPSASPAFADDDKQPVYLDPSRADDDFSFQGEYRGWQRSNASSRSSQSVGLQVVALGNGHFAAAKYYGGLPGEGWFGGDRFLLEGERSGSIVRLYGGQYNVEVSGGVAILYAQDGRMAGELKRIERVSPTMGARPPKGAIVLFDGSTTKHFKNAKITDDNLLEAGTETVDAYGDFCLHAEFYLPYKPLARGQGRANSGLYLQSRYEVQVLDSFGLEGVENECGALYKTKRPDVNMCLPPLQWQTYDIDFTSPKFDAAGKKLRDMTISVWHNGVLVQNRAQIPNKTGAGRPEGPNPLPTKIQDHGNPVLFRNIWLIDKSDPRSASVAWLKLPPSGPPVPIRSYSPPIMLSIGGAGRRIQLGSQPLLSSPGTPAMFGD